VSEGGKPPGHPWIPAEMNLEVACSQESKFPGAANLSAIISIFEAQFDDFCP
jgi:hypothetical protein